MCDGRFVDALLRHLIFCLLIAVTASSAVAQTKLPKELKDIGIDQRLDEQVPLDLQFRDESGKAVKLGDYFSDKPVILVLAYFRCPMLCGLVLNGVVHGMSDMSLLPGKDYQVITVSFDPRETPELAAKKKQTYVAAYGRPMPPEAWTFLTGKQEEIDRLTKAVGFRYIYDAKQDQYIHPAGIMVVTPTGKISRYFYGIRYDGRDLRLGLIEASSNKIGSPADQILLYCFHYDPSLGKYSTSILNLVRAGGALTVVFLGAMVWFLIQRERHKRQPAGEGRPR